MGGGVAVFDYNGDGRLDLLLLNGTSWDGLTGGISAGNPANGGDRSAEHPLPALYRNDGQWRFTGVTREAGLDFSFYGMGVAAGDYDNDGDPDLFLTAVGPCRLLRNDRGVFRDVTLVAGVGGERDDWTTSAGWFDYDLDGDLDLFACTYVRWSRQINLNRALRPNPQGGSHGSLAPQNFDGSHSRLYRNEGGGLFSDVSRDAGIEVVDETGAPVGKALGVVLADVSGDEWPDIVVANDTVRNFAFINQKDGSFAEQGQLLGLAYGPDGKARSGMGIDAADFRSDGGLGVSIGNFAGETTALFVSQSGQPRIYSDESIPAGIGAPSRPYLTFGVCFFDYDLDGRLDLLTANGHVDSSISAGMAGQGYQQSAQLFWNAGLQGKPEFREVTAAQAGLDLFRPLAGRGAAYGDFDADGDLDIVLTAVGDRPRLLRNDQQLGHHFVRVALVGSRTNRDAIGARVELKAGGVWQRLVVSPTKSYLSQCERTLTFGLGQSTKVEEARVVWPGGRVQPIAGLEVDFTQAVLEEAGN